jgi:hypothetical protein
MASSSLDPHATIRFWCAAANRTRFQEGHYFGFGISNGASDFQILGTTARQPPPPNSAHRYSEPTCDLPIPKKWLKRQRTFHISEISPFLRGRSAMLTTAHFCPLYNVFKQPITKRHPDHWPWQRNSTERNRKREVPPMDAPLPRNLRSEA